MRHVVVPAVAPEVYRVAAFANPLDAPLLAGPVDVHDRGELAVTAALDQTAPGATVELGLGVDAAVKAARNARFREEATGMLRGALKLVHEVTITVESLGTRPVQLEIRERLSRPAADEEDVEVHVAADGLVTWTVELPARQRRAIALEYVVKTHDSVSGAGRGTGR